MSIEYCSTRNSELRVSSAEAIARGLSSDGGLFLPVTIPRLTASDFAVLHKMDYRTRAAFIMKLFLDDYTKEELRCYVNQAYADNYSNSDIAPVTLLSDGTGMLELWHGPTCAFKDMALQMLPHLLASALKKTGESRNVCILVATSGDTGKAALEGFKDVKDTKIAVFYPRDGVSNAQKLQMITQEGENVFVCAVNGNFDDAQNGVKAIFADKRYREALNARGYFLSSANSINWGRLLPQIVYYISACCDFHGQVPESIGKEINFCVPTGNFGNILAGWYAKKMGAPIGRLICASNKNNILTDFIETGVYDRNRDFYATSSPSMDILVSSNLERLLFSLSGDCGMVRGFMNKLTNTGRYEVDSKLRDEIGRCFSAGFCGEDDTKKYLKKTFEEQGYLIDTHTAVGKKVLSDYIMRTGDGEHSIVVSTASPYKFCESVLEALGHGANGIYDAKELERISGQRIPAALSGLDKRPERFLECVDKGGMEQVVSAFLGMKNM